MAHLATDTFAAKSENVVLLAPPGIGKDAPDDRPQESKPHRTATASCSTPAPIGLPGSVPRARLAESKPNRRSDAAR